MAKEILKNIRTNPETGEVSYYFPMKVKTSADKEYARRNGLEIGWARLGNRKYKAIFVPCKLKEYDSKGRVIFLDTPEEVQHRIYLDLIKDEMSRQDAEKQDGRCPIPDGKGGVKRCPCRVPNPNYVDGSKEHKTIPVKCEGCIYEPFRQEHTTVTFTTLDHEGEDGSVECYEAPAPAGYYEGERYERLREAFLAYVDANNPKLTALAEKLTEEYNRSEAAKEIDIPTGTAGSRRKLLQDLCEEFLDSTIIF